MKKNGYERERKTGFGIIALFTAVQLIFYLLFVTAYGVTLLKGFLRGAAEKIKRALKRNKTNQNEISSC